MNHVGGVANPAQHHIDREKFAIMTARELSEAQSYWFTGFQISALQRVLQCSEALKTTCRVAPRRTVSELMHGHSGEVFYLVIWFEKIGLECWLYENGAMFMKGDWVNCRFEVTDFSGEDEMLEHFIRQLGSELEKSDRTI